MNKILPNTIILKDQLHKTNSQLGENSRWLCFANPLIVIQAKEIEEVKMCLKEIELHVDNGLHAAGFISYEASPAFDGAMKTYEKNQLPLLWFGIYRNFEIIDKSSDGNEADFSLGEWKPSVTVNEYNEAIAKIKKHIYDGNTYQVNYTFRLRNEFFGDSWAFFLKLQQVQNVGYSAYVKFDKFSICSVSPELFFSKEKKKIVCKPMKGTVKRGLTNAQDDQRAQWLQSSEKNRAENVMIVDMIRNDLGAIADIGTVNVEKLFSIEKYATVHQMTSTVVANTSASISEIFGKMFPCASITGAPKVKTMEIIQDLEADPRGVYTGSIGYISPDGSSQFNVAIRTVVIDSEKNTAEYGVGGGIVWDSDAADEYEECKSKAAVLMQSPPEFDLFETILWNPIDGWYLLDRHIARLADSAKYFNFKIFLGDLHDKINSFALKKHTERCRVKIMLSRIGSINLEHFPIKKIKGNRVGIAREPIPQNSPFVFHKTTNRRVYEQALEGNTAYDDLLYWNSDGFITESSIANVIVDIHGELLTPPVLHGVLPGIFRGHLLGAGIIKEAPVHMDVLNDADNIFLINSLRGWMKLEKEKSDNHWKIQTEFCYGMSLPTTT